MPVYADLKWRNIIYLHKALKAVAKCNIPWGLFEGIEILYLVLSLRVITVWSSTQGFFPGSKMHANGKQKYAMLCYPNEKRAWLLASWPW